MENILYVLRCAGIAAVCVGILLVLAEGVRGCFFNRKNRQKAERILKKLTAGGYGIIYVVEEFIEKMPQVFEKYKEMQTPAIIPIPSCKGSTGFGIGNVKKYVEQAVGSDIIFNEE